jgi:DNA-binding NarL/FixJ family response regulator
LRAARRGTVKLHIHSIFMKLGAHKRYMLIYLMNGSQISEKVA